MKPGAWGKEVPCAVSPICTLALYTISYSTGDTLGHREPTLWNLHIFYSIFIESFDVSAGVAQHFTDASVAHAVHIIQAEDRAVVLLATLRDFWQQLI